MERQRMPYCQSDLNLSRNCKPGEGSRISIILHAECKETVVHGHRITSNYPLSRCRRTTRASGFMTRCVSDEEKWKYPIAGFYLLDQPALIANSRLLDLKPSGRVFQEKGSIDSPLTMAKSTTGRSGWDWQMSYFLSSLQYYSKGQFLNYDWL